MFERSISVEEVEATIVNGLVIKEYPDDKPYPSVLVYNKKSNDPLHVVYSEEGMTCYVITAYKPSLDEWYSDFATRRES